MTHRGVDFAVDLIGVGVWRWTIHPRRDDRPALIGQAWGTRHDAIAACIQEIDTLLARDGGARPVDSDV